MIGMLPRAAPTALFLALFAGLALSACATGAQEPGRLEVSPAITSSKTPSGRGEAYYAAAVRAIGRRDYETALETLQAAKAVAPADLRILNAFGVVYDKLGRFDISARYYTAALALDPASSVIQANMAYSRELGRKAVIPRDDRSGSAPDACPNPPADPDRRPACEV